MATLFRPNRHINLLLQRLSDFSGWKIRYKELGKDYLNRRREGKIVKNHIKRLKDLGYEVELKKVA